MNKKIYLFIAIIAVFFVIIFFNKGSDDSIITIKKEKKEVKQIIKFKVYRDGLPLKWIRVRAVKNSKIKKNVIYQYRWYINGEEVDNKTNNLKTSSLIKGDKVYCKILSEYGDIKQEIKTEIIIIPNSPPGIKYSPIAKFKVPGTFNYQINAEDPDGDDLTYMLIEPLDMNIIIDENTGELNWDITESMVNYPKEQIDYAKLEDGSDQKDTQLKTNIKPISNIMIRFKVIDSEGAVSAGRIDLNLKRGEERGS